MKFALVLATVFVAASAVPHPRTVQQEWNSFKSKHVKVYNSADEEAKRLAIFHQNLIKIKEHNKLYEQGLSTFKMGVNSFTDMTSEEFMAYVNNSGVHSRPRFLGSKVKLSSVNAPPKSVDWRTKNILTPVKDQGMCGACYAFAITGALEAHYALKTGKVISLSEQQLVDCSKGYGNLGCKGGNIQKTFQYVRDNYIAYEDSYPYKEKKGVCHQAKVSPVDVSSIVVLDAFHETMCNAIAKFPVAVNLHATDKLHLYEGGIFEDSSCNPLSVNHVVLLVGYNEDGGYWIIKNSWGTDWGEHGYVRLSYKYDCGVESDATYPVLA